MTFSFSDEKLARLDENIRDQCRVDDDQGEGHDFARVAHTILIGHRGGLLELRGKILGWGFFNSGRPRLAVKRAVACYSNSYVAFRYNETPKQLWILEFLYDF